MRRLISIWLLLAVTAHAAPVNVPPGIDHMPYDRLLEKYVNDRGLVDYRQWKANAADLHALHDYTTQLDSAKWDGTQRPDGRGTKAAPTLAEGDEKIATLINAYNALTIQWILDNYPVKSIKATNNPWGAKRHWVGGRAVSLDEIEQDTLRPLVGYRIHATLVCAAKSCPPLRAGAYTGDKLDIQLDAAMRRWLGREDLNRFVPVEKRVELSKIFSWYGKDFGNVQLVLGKYAPVKCSDCKIIYRPYDWSLNEQ